MTKKKAIPESQVRVIESLVAQGLTDGRIGEEYGVSGCTIGNFRRRHGIESRAVPDRSGIKRNRETRSIPAGDREKVRAMAQQGVSDPQIARHYGCTASAVGLFRRRHAIPLRVILTRPPEVKGVEVRFGRPKELEGYYDEELRHWVRVFDRMPAIGDLRPENENDEKRELERELHAGETREAGRRPNFSPGWTGG